MTADLNALPDEMRAAVESFLREVEIERWSRPTPEQMAELCRTWLAVQDAPVAWGGISPSGQWYAGQDWRDAAHVRLHLSGFGTPTEQARITATRVRIVPIAATGNGGRTSEQ